MPIRPRRLPSIGTLSPAGLALVIAVLLPAAEVAAAEGQKGRGHPPRTRPAVAAPDPRCALDTLDTGAADDLLADRYRFTPHPVVQLAWPIDWTADPFGDRNWRFQLHGLAWLEPLLARWSRTGDVAARDRAMDIARSWLAENPRRDPPSRYSWEEHATALRASTLACLAGTLPDPDPDWLSAGLRLHGRVLADPRTPVPAGNHALNQALGLLDVACAVGRTDWGDVAEARLARLLPESVDRQGVSNEQAIGYERYVLVRWRLAQERLAACGRGPLPGIERLDRMVRLLAFATLPDGTYLTQGDTYREPADPVTGTIAEFAATTGASGPRPTRRVAAFDAGYLLARTGWGDERPFADEVHLGLRWGPGRSLHGHDDGGSITLYGGGAALLLDPGFAGYDPGPWRDWFRSREAHDTVTVDGRASDATRATRLVRRSTTANSVEGVVRVTAIRGVTHTRRVVFSLDSGIAIVEDRLRARRPMRTHQWWHLPSDADPGRTRRAAWTRRERGNVTIRQLIGTDAVAIVRGRRSPRQGWVSERWGRVQPAPVVDVRQAGRWVRYLTLLVPSTDARPTISVRGLRITRTGFRVEVEVAGRRERFVADAGGAIVEPLPATGVSAS